MGSGVKKLVHKWANTLKWKATKKKKSGSQRQDGGEEIEKLASGDIVDFPYLEVERLIFKYKLY